MSIPFHRQLLAIVINCTQKCTNKWAQSSDGGLLELSCLVGLHSLVNCPNLINSSKGFLRIPISISTISVNNLWLPPVGIPPHFPSLFCEQLNISLFVIVLAHFFLWFPQLGSSSELKGDYISSSRLAQKFLFPFTSQRVALFFVFYTSSDWMVWWGGGDRWFNVQNSNQRFVLNLKHFKAKQKSVHNSLYLNIQKYEFST